MNATTPLRWARVLVLVALSVASGTGVGCTGGGGRSAEPPTLVQAGGVLRDAAGNPIANATLTFHSDPVTALTDALGQWTAQVTAGAHDLIIIAVDGSTVFTGSVTVAADGRITSVVQTGGSGVGSLLRDDDAASQGACPNEIITGNCSLLAALTKEGRLAAYFFPNVNAFNHIPYSTNASKTEARPYLGSGSFEGSYAGLRVDGKDYWLMDDEWTQTVSYLSSHTSGGHGSPVSVPGTTPVVSIQYTHKQAPLFVVTETTYVVTDESDLVLMTPQSAPHSCLVRHFDVSGLADGSVASLLYRSRFDPNAFDQWPWLWISGDSVVEKDWVHIDEGGAVQSARTLLWRSVLANSGYEVRVAGSRDGFQLKDPDGIWTSADSGMPTPSTTLDPGNLGASFDLLSGHSACASWDLGLGASRAFTVIIAPGRTNDQQQGRSSADCVASFVRSGGYRSTLDATVDAWVVWHTKSDKALEAQNWSASDLELRRRWLTTIKLMADRSTGGISASPTRQPKFYPAWPRDGVYQALAYLVTGHEEEAAAFFRWLFRSEVLRDGDHWSMCYDVATGENLGYPESPLGLHIEQDQMPTVLWGLGQFQRITRGLPSGVSLAQVEQVANYVQDAIVTPTSREHVTGGQTVGLLRRSFDWEEDFGPDLPWPWSDRGQTLYTNCAAVAGLRAAWFLLGKDKYRTAADSIKSAIVSQLVKDGAFVTGVYCPAHEDVTGLQVRRGDGHNLMALGWPFRAFPLDEAMLVNYYHGVASEFRLSDEKTWIPGYLFTYLFEHDVSAHGLKRMYEVSGVDVVKAHMEEAESALTRETSASGQPDSRQPGLLRASTHFVLDQVKGASVPLGWSQSFGILALYAKNDPSLVLFPDVAALAASSRQYDADPMVDGSFEVPVEPATNPGVTSMTSCSFKAGSSPGLVVGTVDQKIAVLVNRGDGTFHEAKLLEVGGIPSAIACGDLDGDGAADLAVLRQGSKNVLLLKGDGVGGFTAFPVATLSLGSEGASLVLADLAQSASPGSLDLAVACQGPDAVLVFGGNGDGTFTSVAGLPPGGAPTAVVAFDLEGDGLTDLAVANNTGDTVGYYRAVGAGSFAAPKVVPAGNAVYGRPYALASASVNADAVPDLVVVNGRTNTLTCFSGSATNPAVPFTPLVDATLPPSTTGVSVVDVSGDGTSDFLVSTHGSPALRVLLGDGQGDFGGTEPPSVSATGAVTVSAAADFNGDGILDLGVASSVGGVSIRWGKGGGSFAQRRDFVVGRGPRASVLADLNADGKMDAIVVNETDGTITSLLGEGSGAFRRAGPDIAVGTTPVHAAVGDLDGDATPDVAVACNPSGVVELLRGDGSGGFTSLGTLTGFLQPVWLAIRDLDGDGTSDVLVLDYRASVTTFKGMGNGTFQRIPGSFFGTPGYVHSASLGDVNGDGKLDLAVPGYGDNAVAIYFGVGDGTFDHTPAAAWLTIQSPIGVALADLNGDGFADLLVTSAAAGARVYLTNRLSSGQVELVPGASLPNGGPFPTLGDVNGDGHLDVVLPAGTANHDGCDAVAVFAGDGLGAFSEGTYYSVGPTPYAATIGPIDDGAANDILVVNYGGSGPHSVTVLMHR